LSHYTGTFDLDLSFEDHGLGLERFSLESKPGVNHVTLHYVSTALIVFTEMELFGP